MRLRLARAAALSVAAVVAADRLQRRPFPEVEDLRGRAVVVTGAGSGIGRSIALECARRGAAVHVVDRDGDAAVRVAGEVDDAGGTGTAHRVDVSDPSAVAALADLVLDAGLLDLLFLNAGIGHAGAVVDTTLDDWRRLVDVNLMGVVHGLHAFLPRLVEQDRRSHVMATASLAGLTPSPGLVPYSTTKAAVVGLVEGLSPELSGTPVTVSALCPGVITTSIITTSTLRGDWSRRRDRIEQTYARRGTSADVVARQALDGIARGLVVVPTPRHHVLPGWWAKRYVPPAGRALTAATARLVGGR